MAKPELPPPPVVTPPARGPAGSPAEREPTEVLPDEELVIDDGDAAEPAPEQRPEPPTEARRKARAGAAEEAEAEPEEAVTEEVEPEELGEPEATHTAEPEVVEGAEPRATEEAAPEAPGEVEQREPEAVADAEPAAAEAAAPAAAGGLVAEEARPDAEDAGGGVAEEAAKLASAEEGKAATAKPEARKAQPDADAEAFDPAAAGPLRKKVTEPVSWAAGLPYTGEGGSSELEGERANRVAVLLSALKVPAPAARPAPSGGAAPAEPAPAEPSRPGEPPAVGAARTPAVPPPAVARDVGASLPELDEGDVTELDDGEAIDELHEVEELHEEDAVSLSPVEFELDDVAEEESDADRLTPPPVPPPQPFEIELGDHPAAGVVVVKETETRAESVEEATAEDDGVMTSAPPDEEDESTASAPQQPELQPPPPVPTPDAVAEAPEPPVRAETTPAPPPVALEEDAAKGRRRQRAWFEEIFDEDYLRTLPRCSTKWIAREVDFIEESLQPAPESEILDIGSGDGRHAIELAARGYRVTGLDRSLALLVRAADASQARNIKVNFVQSDFREMSYGEEFDAAYCLSTTFGYFDDDTNRKMIGAINAALRVGGRLLLGVVNRDFIIRDLPARRWWEGDGCVVLEEVDFNFFTSRVISKRSVVMHDGRHLEYEISVRCYSLHELGKILHHAGFRVLEVAGNMAHRTRFFGNQSSTLLMLAEKRSKP